MCRTTGLAASLLALLVMACDGQDTGKGENGVKTAAHSIKPENDSYVWLEKIEDEKALDWVRERNAATREILEADPRFETFHKEALAILTATDRIPYGQFRGGFVYNFWQDESHVRGIWRRTTLESYRSKTPKWDVLLDIDKLAKDEKENWVFQAVDCLPPAYDRCLVQLSRGGKDASVIREFDVVTRSFVHLGFKLREAKSGVAWIDRNQLLVGTDWGEGSLTSSGYPRVVKAWKRGTPISEAATVFEGEPADVAVFPAVTQRPEAAVPLVVRAIDFFNSTYHYVKDDGTTVQLPLPTHAEVQGVFQDQVLVTLRKDWTLPRDGKKDDSFEQGSLVSFALKPILETGELGPVQAVYTPDERSSIRGVSTTRDTVLVSLLSNVASKLRAYQFDKGKWSGEDVEIPGNGTATVTSADDFNNMVFLNFESYLTPNSLLELSVADRSLKRLKALPERFNAKGLIVDRREAKSRDGEMIPYFVVRPKNKPLDGSLPTLLYGYGGFEEPLVPRYRSAWGKLWLERGGALAVANIRGGGEFGPRWHEAGLKLNRQRVYDDFIAVSEDLIERKLTSPRRLGIMGRSNGGLLVGVAFTQRPDLYRAVVCVVPLLDMMRYTLLPPGASWIGEYGDPVNNAEERSVIRSYSPYQNLRKGAEYPKVFFLTSTKDDRVHPGHARKMAARMEEMGHSFFYYENIEGGHPGSANLRQEADNTALEFVYLSRMLMDEEP